MGRVGLEPTMVKPADLQSAAIATRRPTQIFSISITRGPSPYVHNLRVYSISEETQSELRGATPNFWPQEGFHFPYTSRCFRSYRFILTQEWLPTTFTHHSELILNSLISINPSRINVVAFGLLAPRPYLIAILLWHQRKLPYWCTKVWNSHQLIPNLAYSPQGRLLRKR